jgi:hypothetical protein
MNKIMQPIFITKDLWEFVIEGYGYLFDEEYKALDDKWKTIIKRAYKER